MVTATYQRRPVKVQAVQWRGDNAAELTALLGSDFDVLDAADRANCDDPEATSEVIEMPDARWRLMYIGDWAVKDGDAQYRVSAYEFENEWEPTR
ncbi:hypothetical protein [Actinoplanes sp. NPDC051494]|uniref:hypothetical protein n=1 Tax=Actinoplanes sp. NPDC051494 TaxID=3363907 RepID=UPI0037B06603